MKPGTVQPEVTERCQGYYGFGSGYELGKLEISPQEAAGRRPYCDNCSFRQMCWQAHRSRVQQISPDTTKLLDDFCKQHGGPEGLMKFIEATEQTKENFIEPYMSVMMGNWEDGMLVGRGGKPKDRGVHSLPYPFVGN